MLLPFYAIFTAASVRGDRAFIREATTNPDGFIDRRFLFKEVSEILLTENFIRVEFFNRSLTLYYNIKPEIE